jgi:hypothetical protein
MSESRYTLDSDQREALLKTGFCVLHDATMGIKVGDITTACYPDSFNKLGEREWVWGAELQVVTIQRHRGHGNYNYLIVQPFKKPE